MYYQITKTIPILLLVAVLTFVYSCNNDAVEPDQVSSTELTNEEALKLLMEEMATLKEQSIFTEVDHLDGKNPADYYREQQQNNSNRMTCMTPPNCPFVTINDQHSFLTNGVPCTVQYSYDLYDCGSGNSVIFNFQIDPISGNTCPAYAIRVTNAYNNGELEFAQVYLNLITSIVLRNIEDNLFNFSGQGFNQASVTSYIPNYCAAACLNNGGQVECGEDCCIRIAAYNYQLKQRTTSVFSAQECGGNMITCDNNQVRLCENFDCPLLDL